MPLATTLEEETEQLCKYSMISSNDDFENQKIVQYGVELIFGSRDTRITKKTIPNISTDKQVVTNLLQMLEGQEVSPIQLEYIVEDYITQLYSY